MNVQILSGDIERITAALASLAGSYDGHTDVTITKTGKEWRAEIVQDQETDASA